MARGTGDKRTAGRSCVVQCLANLGEGLLSRVTERDVRHDWRGRQEARVVEDGPLTGDDVGRGKDRAGMIGGPALPADQGANSC